MKYKFLTPIAFATFSYSIAQASDSAPESATPKTLKPNIEYTHFTYDPNTFIFEGEIFDEADALGAHLAGYYGEKAHEIETDTLPKAQEKLNKAKTCISRDHVNKCTFLKKIMNSDNAALSKEEIILYNEVSKKIKNMKILELLPDSDALSQYSAGSDDVSSQYSDNDIYRAFNEALFDPDISDSNHRSEGLSGYEISNRFPYNRTLIKPDSDALSQYSAGSDDVLPQYSDNDIYRAFNEDLFDSGRMAFIFKKTLPEPDSSDSNHSSEGLSEDEISNCLPYNRTFIKPHLDGSSGLSAGSSDDDISVGSANSNISGRSSGDVSAHSNKSSTNH